MHLFCSTLHIKMFFLFHPSVPSVYPILQFLQFFEGYPSLSFSYKSTLNSMPDFHSRFTARPPLIPMSWDQYYICKYYILHYPPPRSEPNLIYAYVCTPVCLCQRTHKYYNVSFWIWIDEVFISVKMRLKNKLFSEKIWWNGK